MYLKEPINLGLDIDGVLVNNFKVWKTYYESNSVDHNHNPALISVPDSPNWDFWPDLCKKCFDYCLHNKEIILGYELVDDALEVIAFLKSLNFNFYVISTRPQDVEGYTKHWVNSKFGLLVNDTFITDDKVTVAKELGIKYHVDDGPHVIESFLTQKEIQHIIFNHPYNKGLQGPRIETWPQYAAYIMWALHK